MLREPLEHRHDWDELVLPERVHGLLRGIAAELRSRREARVRAEQVRADELASGLTVLFTGPPGTGKTTAALILGADANLPVSRVDLSEGPLESDLEAEQFAERLFAPRSRSEGILFLSVADVFFVRYSRPARRPAGVGALSPQLLLAHARRYPGLVIFASGLAGRLQPELAERFDVVVDFPFPESDARREIWRRMLPRDAQVTTADLDLLASSFKLPGAAIRSCCLAAASDASESQEPVQMAHLARALRREYRDRLMSDHTRKALGALGTTHKPDRGGGAGLEHRPSAEEAPAHSAPSRLPDERRATPSRSGSRQLADRRPGSDSPIRRFRVAPLARALVPSGILLAAVLGFLVARTTGGHASPARLNQQTSAGLIRVSFPSGWRAHPPAPSGLAGLTDEVSLSPASRPDRALVIGRTNASDQRPLPAAALAVLHGAPTAQSVTLHGVVFYRYMTTTTARNSPSEIVYTLPTTSGTIVGVCMTRGAGPGFVGDCERIIATIRLTSGAVLPSRVSASYIAAVNQAMHKLNAVRLSAGSRLRTVSNAAAQAKLARQLGAAHLAAAAALQRLYAGPASAANAALVKALLATGAAYDALARAAASNNVGGYRAASESLKRAASMLNSAFPR